MGADAAPGGAAFVRPRSPRPSRIRRPGEGYLSTGRYAKLAACQSRPR
jgi:hypothetical protein